MDLGPRDPHYRLLLRRAHTSPAMLEKTAIHIQKPEKEKWTAYKLCRRENIKSENKYTKYKMESK